MKKLPKMLPAAPLIPWIMEEAKRGTIEAFAERCNVSERRLREVLSGRATKLTFENVDRLVTYGSHNFFDFYPEYDDEEKFCSINDIGVAPRPKKFCTIEGCGGALHAKGMCQVHYSRVKRKERATA